MPTIPEPYLVKDLPSALARRALPTTTTWNRLEGRPRAADPTRALRAEVRDAMWMLARQWQLGELTGDDAGTPVFAKVQVRTAPLASYRAGGLPSVALPAGPLEATVEQRPFAWVLGDAKQHFDLRAQLGRHWGKLLVAGQLDGYLPAYLSRYPVVLPPAADPIYAHRRSWQLYAALAGRAIDGGDLLSYLADPAHRASDGIALQASTDGEALDALGAELIAWFAAQYRQPAADAAWQAPALEYEFGCAAAQDGESYGLAATEYAEGRIEWYSFEGGPTPANSPPPGVDQVVTRSLIPTRARFEGMPEPRWWTLEDRKTDFGAIAPSTTDLPALLLTEFALLYSDDWFLVPLRVPVGSIARVDGLAVTTTFGDRLWITAAGSAAADAWQHWSMFRIATASGALLDPTLVIPSSAAAVQSGAPLEQVAFARDEVANMAWAVERTVPTPDGIGRSGGDEAAETLAFYQARLAAPTATPSVAPIRYRAMTTVPEHWIPFVPVHVPGDNREIQLQRSRMLRILDGDPTPPAKVAPRTQLLRTGLEATPAQPYFLFEERVPRGGVQVTQAFRRARGPDGRPHIWLGMTTRPGRGERSSGLAFDAIVSG